LDNYYAFPRSDATLSSRGTSITQTFGRYGASPVSSAASGLTPFPTCSPMSIDAGCGGSRVGPHSCSTTWVTSSGTHQGTWSLNTEVGVELTPGFASGVSRRRSARPHNRYLHNSCCIRGRGVFCTNLPWGTNSRKCCLPPRPVHL
jgi:hypothetical protein